MSIGAKTNFDKTFLTTRTIYRSDIIVVDSGPDDNGIPEIRLDVQEDVKTQMAVYQKAGKPPNCDPRLVRLTDGERLEQRAAAERAYNGHLEMYVWFTAPVAPECQYVGPRLIDGIISSEDQRCFATLRVWVWAGDSGVDPVVGPLPVDPDLDDSLSSSSTSDSFGRWCLVHEQSVVCDTFIPLRDIPAGRYRVTVDDLSTDCEVDILEQHTE